MITFFEITGFNPRYASKNPTALVEKRIEDLIKIIKSQERDIFKPILDKLAGMGGGLHESPDYARLMNEMHDLQERNRKLQQQLAEYGEGSPADVEKERGEAPQAGRADKIPAQSGQVPEGEIR